VEVMSVFQRLNRENGLTIVLVTHEADIAQYADRVIVMRDGRITRDQRVTAPRDAAIEVAALPPMEEHLEEQPL
jgi:ABC-type lipoprotein export system ATPase subunit